MVARKSLGRAWSGCRPRIGPLAVPILSVVLVGCAGGPGTVNPSANELKATPLGSSAPSSPQATTAAETVDARPVEFDLGRDWRVREPSAIPRDVDEVLALVIPLGCVQRSPLPAPTRVLETTYKHRTAKLDSVVLRMDFSTRAAVRQFLGNRNKDLRACRRQPVDEYSGAATPVRSVMTVTPLHTRSERFDPFVPARLGTWTEHFIARNTTIYALAVSSGAHGSPELRRLDGLVADFAV